MAYKTLLTPKEAEIIQKKSRFIGILIPVESEEAAKAHMITIRKQHHQASHYCYAFRIRDHLPVERYSDDGEPSGTAGMPMLEVLRGAGLVNVLMVSVRYFGGTKLGTGGLVRAYTQCAQSAIAAASIIEVGQYRRLSATVDYGLSGKVEHHIATHELLQDAVVYGTDVTYSLYVKANAAQELIQTLTDITDGKAVLVMSDPIDGYILDGKVITGAWAQ